MLNLEDTKTVAFLGPRGSFCDMASDKFCEKFNINSYSEPCKTIKEVVEYVDNNSDSLGVLPVENFIEGTVRETLDSVIETKNPNIKILSELYMPVNYCLLSRTTEFYSLTGVISTPEILAKCGDFIKSEMPMNLNIVESASIPESAMSLQNYNLTYSAIGTEKIADICNLNILKENISDVKNNQTRYILFGDYETDECGNDKTSIAFSSENKPGALLSILNIFMDNNINLSYIASHPSKNQFGEYIMTVSFDGHVHNPKIIKTLGEIKDKAQYMRFLGSYKKGKPKLN